MKRLIAYISGDVQKVGYRGRVIDIASAFGLKGMVENLKDGRVLIIAEGEDKKLEWFEDAIDIKNTLIKVASIDKEYSSAGGEFDDFGKLVFKGETDARLDAAVVRLEKLIDAINNMNENLGNKIDNLGGKIDTLGESLSGKIDDLGENLGGKIDSLGESLSGKIDDLGENLGGKIDQMNENLGGKMDESLAKQDLTLEKQDLMLEKQDELLIEVKDLNKGLNEKIDKDIVELKADVSEIKSALRAKGII